MLQRFALVQISNEADDFMVSLTESFDNPENPNNNHLIFSMGHVSPLLYSTYKEIGNTFIVVEGNWPEGGLGDAVLEALSKRGGPMPEVVKLAVRSMPESGTPAVLMYAAIISARHIVAAVEALVHRKQEPKEIQMMQQLEVTPSPDWACFQGVLTTCLAKLVELYHDAMQEDPGNYDWSVQVKNAALGEINEEIPPQVLLERVKQGVVGQEEALLEYDTSWLGHAIEGLWVFAKLYLVGSTSPAALVHRIDFEEEDAKSPLNEDFEEVNDERSLDEI